jgi:hypothetical protein
MSKTQFVDKKNKEFRVFGVLTFMACGNRRTDADSINLMAKSSNFCVTIPWLRLSSQALGKDSPTYTGGLFCEPPV